jgi:putative MATE family efflux protein
MRNRGKAVLTEGPVGKLLVKLTMPMIVGIIGIVIFNLTDTFYVGRLGINELAALSFTFPVVLVVMSLAFGVGIGTSAVVSRAIGEEDFCQVRRLTTDALLLALIIVTFVAGIGIVTIEPVFRLLGATPEIMPLIKRYMSIWYLGVICVVIPIVGNNAIRATGDTKTPSIIMTIAAIMNIILDPLFIFGIGPFPRLGLAGAAITTVITRAIIMVVALYVLGYRDKMITLARPGCAAVVQSWRKILYIGVPNMAIHAVIPITAGIITRLLATYGSTAVAAYGVSCRIEFFALAILMALRMVIAPFVGQNIGAGRYERVVLGLRYGKQFSLGWGLMVFVVFAVAARPIASIFSDNTDVVSTIVLYLRIVPIAYGLQGILWLSTAAMNVLNKPFHAAGLTMVQMFVLYIPLAFVGSHLFGLPGIFAALAFAYAAAGVGSHLVLDRILASGVSPERAKCGV